MILKSCQNGGKWHNQNLIIDGNLSKINVLRYAIQCVTYFGTMCSIFLTMYYSHLSNVNVGTITTLWSVQSLAAAFVDYFVNNEKLTIKHFLGILAVTAAALLISFSRAADPTI